LDEFEFPPGEQSVNLVRRQYESMAASEGADSVHAELQRADPASAALIHPHNTRRVIRALEMLEKGTSYATQSSGFSTRESVYATRFIGLTMERAALYQRIDARVDVMIEEGLLGEVEGLLDAGFREALTARQAIGYKELVPVIESGEGLDAAVDSIKRATRRYAKRQLTWFKADPRVFWIDVTDLSLAQATALALAELD
jgi:tRNA dimethylallyltransferase